MNFDAIYCLNQADRPDRWELAEAEFKRVGIEVQRFYSIPDKAPYLSFCLSQKAIIEDIAKRELQTALVLEDDCIFSNFENLDNYMAQLPKNWDIFYLGANVTDSKPKRISDNIFKIRHAWTSHAIAYKLGAVKMINQEYSPQVHGMYDDWLSRNILPKLNAFVCIPMIARQRAGYSDLWGKWADYTGAFDHQDNTIK